MQCLATAAFAPREYVRGWWRSPVLWARSCRWLRAVRSPRSSPVATPGHLVRGRADCWMRWWHPPAGLVTMPIERSVRMKADRMVGRCARGGHRPPGPSPCCSAPCAPRCSSCTSIGATATPTRSYLCEDRARVELENIQYADEHEGKISHTQNSCVDGDQQPAIPRQRLVVQPRSWWE